MSAARRLLDSYEKEAFAAGKESDEKKQEKYAGDAEPLVNLTKPGAKQTFKFMASQQKKLEHSGWKLSFTKDKRQPRHYLLELKRKDAATPKFNAIVREVGKKTKCERKLVSDELIGENAQLIEFDMMCEYVEVELQLVHEKTDEIELDCTNACDKHCPE